MTIAANRDKYPSLARLRAEYGTQKIEAIIKLHLIDLCENVNLKRPLRDTQVDNIAREIVAEFYSLTIADIHVIFRKAKTGEYGEFYESLDMPKVLSWFRGYFSDRCTAAAQQSVNESGIYRTYDTRREGERWRAYFDRMEKKNKQDK